MDRDFEPTGEIYGDTGDYCTAKDNKGNICGGVLKMSYHSNGQGYWREWVCERCGNTESE
jgi:ribosomal protein S27AE